MNRKTLTAVAAFAILGLVALFALRQPEKGEGAGDRQRPIAKIDPGKLDTISITRQGVTTTLDRNRGKLSVKAPVAGTADEANVKAAFEALEKLELGNLVSENKAKWVEFQLDEAATTIHVVGKNGDATLVDLFIGKTVGSGTMVRLAGKDEVWQAVGPLRSTFDRPASEWRDRTVTTFSTADAEMVTIKAKDGSVAIVKKSGKGAGGEDSWEVVTAVPKIDRLDNAAINNLVAALSSFKTDNFADGTALAAAGLDAPALTVTVALKGGKNATLLVGNKKGADELYLKTPESPQILLAKSATADRIAKRPIELKDKTLSDVGEVDLKEVAVTRGADSYTIVHEGTAWKATKPAGLALDPGRTPQIGGAFKDWKATSFAENVPPAETGLAKPKAVVVMKSTKGQVLTFKIGEETKDKQGVYLMTSKGPEVYVVPKWSTDRLLVKLDDLKKK